MKQTDTAKDEAIKELKTWIKPSGKIVIFITKVSQSGMNRRMKIYKINKNGLSNLTWLVAKVCELGMNDDGVSVGGCGMDMAFWLASSISANVWGRKVKTYKGNSGSCIDWQCIY